MRSVFFARTATVLAELAVLLGACSLVPVARPSATVAPAVTGTPGAAVTPARPATSIQPSTATTRPTEPPATPTTTPLDSTASPTPRPDGNGDRPPAGLLASGDTQVAGRLGSYCYGNTCADIGGWPPKSELPTLSATQDGLQFLLEGDVPFVTWNAAYDRTSSDDRSTPLGEGGYPYDPDAAGSPPPQFLSAEFESPPSGDWVVWVWIYLEDGDLSYAWHVIVP